MKSAVHLVLLAFLICLLKEVAGVLHGATIEDLENMFTEYEIVHPALVTADGDFISHNIRNAPTIPSSARRRRSVDDIETIVVAIGDGSISRAPNNTIDVRNDTMPFEANITTSHWRHNGFNEARRFPTRTVHVEPTDSSDEPPPRLIHFSVTAFGSRMRISVETKEHLIAPGAKSVRFTPDGEMIEKDISSDCLYFGTVSQLPDSAVAISNCEGLAGLIKTGKEEFFIEPLETHDNPSKPQRHVIYRRAASIKSENEGKRMEGHRRTERDVTDSLGGAVSKMTSQALNVDREEHSRSKRHSKRNAYNMEVMLVADYEVVRFHGSEHVENYLLTLMNIVDEIYHDDSLGLHINIILSRIYQLDARRSNRLIIPKQASTSLMNVCKWANDIFKKDPPSNNRRPDNSIFLTRRTFGPAGYAHVTAMCDRLRSCSLNHEDGFSSAFVIAHETGHVLGMDHDGEGNKCGDETSMGSIMAPLVQAAFHRYHWSRCSQQELLANIGDFRCLMDDPHMPHWGPTPLYPGIRYSVDDQCRFDFGQGYRRCTAFPNVDFCKTLWCSHADNPHFCKTKKGPPVDGTECGDNMWCFKSHCVRRDSNQVVDGNWGPWSTYGECSRTCGTGVMYRTRKCNNPPPSNNGRNCVGQNMDPDLCNTRPCPEGRDYRAEQCMYSNGVTINNRRHKWLPYENPKEFLKCQLFCVSKKTDMVVSMGDIVADGTSCSYDDPHGICIRGECVNVGCDKVIGSPLREDACGVCSGNGRDCRNITGDLAKKTKRKLNHYMKMYKIPRGARHIRISEIRISNNSNMFALKNRNDRRYFLNGRGSRVSEGDFPYRVVNAGTVWTYDSIDDVETLAAPGPVNADIILMILIQRRTMRVGIRYSYIMHVNNVPRPRDTYRYVIRKWTSCSVSCGNGMRSSRYGCRSTIGERWVNKRKCSGRTPKPTIQPCSSPCDLIRWHTGSWEECSRSCGVPGIKRRAVSCRRTNNYGVAESIPDAYCLSQPRPDTQQSCTKPACPASWRYGNWSECSTTCGEGIQRRQVICRGRSRLVSANECLGDRPSDVQHCQVTECQRITTTQAPVRSTIAEAAPCTTDQSIFCRLDAITSYCDITGYRKLCCRSCEKHQRQNGVTSRSGQSSAGRPLSVAISNLFSNGTLNGNNETSLESNATGIPSIHGEIFVHPQVLQFPTSASESQDQGAQDVDEETAMESSEDYDDDPEDSEFSEVIQTLAPRNDTLSTPVSMVTNNGSRISASNDGATAGRRKRDVTSVVRSWGRCDVKICGIGKRRPIYGCWDVAQLAWMTSSACKLPVTSQSMCVVPCYQSGLPAVNGGAMTFNSRLSCREVRKDGRGPRTHPHRCNYRRLPSAKLKTRGT
uniref:A disintegrin and metalloproteinase with thrombospondin motifs 3 n=1 Tax=Phallusia mammillata TaxID=59560 RepID=A0A6F9D6C8_9ASCI|nr:A disintegrin and metalloproteinase with thrombospondin motifs 3 [Phallusia mammillata]